MKILRIGILMGIAVGTLYLSAIYRFSKAKELFINRVYADETVSSAALDALSFNEDIEGVSDVKKAISRFYESICGLQGFKDRIVLVMFFGKDAVYYGRDGENIIRSEYAGRAPADLAKELLKGLYAADFMKDPFYGSSLKAEKGSFAVIYDTGGERLAAIGGAKRKERKWNNH